MVWQRYFAQARTAGYGTKIEIPKHAVGDVPSRFEESALAIPNGAHTVYREDAPTDSLQLREYDSRYTVELDRYNPAYHPFQHAAQDAPGYTLAGVGALALVGLWS